MNEETTPVDFREKYIAERMEIFRRICPPLYVDTKLDRLVDPSHEILRTPYTPKGILMVGETRTGKTRTAWMLARAWFVLRDRSLAGFNGGEFGRAVADNYGKGHAQRWHHVLRDYSILVLDDIFKHRMTDAVQDAIFSVIEDRMAWKRPTILTMNNGSAGIKDAVSEDIAEPLIERLKESCDVYKFDESPK